MTTTSQTLLPFEKRTVALRTRPDLRLEKHRFQGRSSWVVKDPVSLRYFQLSEEEYTVLRMLDGTVSPADIKAELEQRYPPRVASYEDVQALLRLFHQRRLVVADSPGQGAQLLRQHREAKRRRTLAALASPLFIRLPGLDPERFLRWLYPGIRWIYRPWCLAACAGVALSALTLIVVRMDAVYAKLPTFQQLFAAHNVVWMMVALAVSKALHELGHALTCKHFGGECHEIGVALLVFTPCLYCDTSDSWMLPNKWHRAAIGAAGMYVEIVLASLCTFLWWSSEPGLFHYLCLNTVFVCSVSTLIFNGNPLLRYDGYYILADLMEVPNLRQRSRAALVGMLGQWCLGIRWTSELVVPERKRVLFALYAVASTCYRWMVLLLILSFLTTALEPYGLQAIGHALLVMCLVGLVVVPAFHVVQFLIVPGRIQQVDPRRASVAASLIVLLGLAILFVPLPHRIMTTAIIQPRDAERIYVEVEGILESVEVQPGDKVTAGQVLARLANTDVSVELEKLRGQRDRLAIRLQNLLRRQGEDPDAARQIPQTKAALADVDDRFRQRQVDQKLLTLTAPIAGTVLPAPELPETEPAEADLPEWSGSPCDRKNRGCLLKTGTMFCLVGDPHDMEAVLVIDQSDFEMVHEGQLAAVKLDEYPGETLRGHIARVAKTETQALPHGLSHKTGGGVTTVTDESGAERPLGTCYQALVAIEHSDGPLLPGFRGRARISVDRRSLGKRMWRLVNQTFPVR